MLGGSVAGPGGVALSTAKYARPGESTCLVELETNICEDSTITEKAPECFKIEDTIKSLF